MRSMLAFLKDKNNWPLLLVPLALLIWGQAGAVTLGTASFHSISDFVSPYVTPVAAGSQGAPISPSVVLVVVDGLRVDASRRMPTVNRLRAAGADRVVQVGQPSLSLPGATVIGTGAWQEQSGVVTNFYTDRVKLDSIFHETRRKGLRTALIGQPSWQQLYPADIDTTAVLPAPPDVETNYTALASHSERIAALALDALRAKPNLALIHLEAPDSAAHGWGAISQQYADATQLVDLQLSQMVAAVDLQQTTFIVTADHGHMDRGGHGGWEPVVLNVPLVMAGRGIRTGTFPDASQADIAPTVATLLGTAIPAHNQGRALLDQLDAPQPLLAQRAVDNAEQIAARYDSMRQALGVSRAFENDDLKLANASLQQERFAAALGSANQSIESIRGQWSDAVDARLNQERLMRLPLALLILAPFGLYAWWWRRARWDWHVPLLGAAAYFVTYNLNFFLLDGLSLSLSQFNTEEQIMSFLAQRVMEAMAALALSMIIVGLASVRAGVPQAVRRAVNALFLIAAAYAVQILLYYVLWDVLATWRLPDLLWGFKYFLDVFQTTAFYPKPYLPVAALLPLLAAIVAWLAALLTRLAQPTAAPGAARS